MCSWKSWLVRVVIHRVPGGLFSPGLSCAKVAGMNAKLEPILVAVTDPILQAEAVHVVAASGRGAVETTDPREITMHAARCHAILCCPTTAAHVATLPPRQRRFLVLGEETKVDWKVATQLHAESVLTLPTDAPVLLEAIGYRETRSGPNEKVIAVLGAAGGVGTSTFAAALALCVGESILVDATVTSGGLDLLLGVEESPGLRWNDFSFAAGGVRANDVLPALICAANGVRLLAHSRNDIAPPTSQDVCAVIDALRGEHPIIVDAGLLGQHDQALVSIADVVIVIVPMEVRGVASANMHLLALRHENLDVVLVARARDWSSLDVSELSVFLGDEPTAMLSSIRGLTKQIETTGLDAHLPRKLAAAAQEVLQACEVECGY